MDLPPADRRTHLDFLDGLRGLAAAFVLAHHCWFELYPDALNHPAGGRTAALVRPLAFGHWAVVVFIVLSGFCLMLPVAADPNGRLRGGAGRFYWRRARRILPPYFAAAGVSVALILTAIGTRNGSHWDLALAPGGGVGRRGLVGAVTLLGDWLGSYQVNHAFWSVQVEWKIYFIFPLLVLATRRFGAWPTVGVTAAVAFAAAGVAIAAGHVALRVHFVGLFAVGVLAADVAARPPRLPAWAATAAAAAAAAVTVGLAWRWGLIPALVDHERLLDAGVALAVAPALVALARRPASWAGRGLSWPPLVWLGGVSYSFYLLHAPLVQVAYRYVVHPLRLPEPIALALLVGTSAGLTLAATVPFFALCERPFMSRRLRRTQPAAREMAVVG